MTEEDMRQFFSGDMMILDGQRIDELAAAIGQDDWKDLGIEFLSEQILKSDKNLTDFIRRFRFQEKSQSEMCGIDVDGEQALFFFAFRTFHGIEFRNGRIAVFANETYEILIASSLSDLYFILSQVIHVAFSGFEFDFADQIDVLNDGLTFVYKAVYTS